MKIQLIGVPLWYGCDNPGTEQAYDCFCQAGIEELVTSCGHHITGMEAVSVPSDEEKHADLTMEYLHGTVEACRNLEQAVKAALADYYTRQGVDYVPILGEIFDHDCEHCEGGCGA